MANTNDEIEELNSLKHAASERRSKRANAASTKRTASKKSAASTPPAGTQEDAGQSPPSEPESESEELFDKLAGQVETVFSEIGEASRERPVLALVSAFAVGILVGHILSRRKD